MKQTTNIAKHYSSGSLLEKIRAGLAVMNATGVIDADVLAPVDEFHIGGRQATVPFLDQLDLGPGARVLDLGCGLGGPARFAAQRYGAQVTGVDLTPEFVETGNALCQMTGLQDQVDLHVGSILDLPFADATFDAAYMIHVGMNIADKHTLCAQAARVLKPGAVIGIYDVMQITDEQIAFPVPWASTPDQSALATPADYRAALETAGFTVLRETDRTGYARDFFAGIAAAQKPANGPPPLGLHLVMGPETGTKIANMVANISTGRIAPVELIARRAS